MLQGVAKKKKKKSLLLWGLLIHEIFEGHFHYVSLPESLFMIHDVSQQVHFGMPLYVQTILKTKIIKLI